jgi:hypothetical protein
MVIETWEKARGKKRHRSIVPKKMVFMVRISRVGSKISELPYTLRRRTALLFQAKTQC